MKASAVGCHCNLSEGLSSCDAELASYAPRERPAKTVATDSPWACNKTLGPTSLQKSCRLFICVGFFARDVLEAAACTDRLPANLESGIIELAYAATKTTVATYLPVDVTWTFLPSLQKVRLPIASHSRNTSRPKKYAPAVPRSKGTGSKKIIKPDILSVALNEFQW